MTTILRHLPILSIFFILFWNCAPAAAQESKYRDDVDFVVDVLRNDYAGWETKTTGEAGSAFQDELAQARTRIADNPKARIWALSMLLDWFDDEHLGLSSNIVSPANPWEVSDELPARPPSTPLEYKFSVKQLSAETILIRVPSFDAGYLESFEALLEEHHDAITSTPNLLIDLRHNSGGTDVTYRRLMSYLYTRPIYTIGAELRVSKRNLQTLQNILLSDEYSMDTKEFVENLLDRVSDNNAQWVGASANGFEITTYPRRYEYPIRVGILGEGAASSGDQFVIDARFSDKVTLLGRPTAGIIDYSNVVSASAPSGDFSIRWPITRSLRLPHEPFDNVGVQPDVPFGPDVTDDVEAAREWLENQS